MRPLQLAHEAFDVSRIIQCKTGAEGIMHCVLPPCAHAMAKDLPPLSFLVVLAACCFVATSMVRDWRPPASCVIGGHQHRA